MVFDYLLSPNTLPTGDAVVMIGIFIVLAIAFNLAAIILLNAFTFLSTKTKTDLDDRIIEACRTPARVFATLSAAYLALWHSFPAMKVMNVALYDLYLIFAYIIAAVTINAVMDVLLVWYGREIVPKTSSKVDDEIFPFVRNLLKVAVYLIFAVFILDKLGIQIAPLLAGLGIAGLAVGLALQDTLANFFAGIHILTDKPFREGDYISVDGGVSGNVDNIGWRSTRVRTVENNYVIVPNSKLSQSVVTNYHSPDQSVQIYYDIGVAYKEDVDNVEKILTAAIKRIQEKNPYMDKAKQPFVRLQQFGDFALIFRYGYYITSYEYRYNVLKDINREIFYAFRENKIEIPYPVRTLIHANPGIQPPGATAGAPARKARKTKEEDA